MKMSDLSHPLVSKRTDKNIVATHHLISLVKRKSLREDLTKCVGIPTDRLAEYVAAYLTKSMVMDADGYDLIKPCGHKIEVKLAFINSNVYSGYAREEAKIGNLKTKTSDLLLFIIDGDKTPENPNYLRLFSMPFNVWKAKWKNDKGSMSFGSIRRKWYNNYQVEVNQL